MASQYLWNPGVLEPGVLNSSGESQSSMDGTVHAFLWTRGTGMQDFGAYPGAFATVPPCCNTINDRGEMAGFAVRPFGSITLVWQGKVPVDLNSLIAANPSGLYLLAAESINNSPLG